MVNHGFSFARVPPIHFGPGKLALLPTHIRIFGRKVLLVTGKSSFQASGKWEPLLAEFKKAELELSHVMVEEEPTTEFVDAVCARFRNQSIDVVVGIGGGSVIDGAKAISAMMLHTNSVLDHLEDVGRKIPHSGKKIPYIAIPTTSGTGSEVTKNAVISKIGPNGFKKSLRHDNLIPDCVIVDPELMVSCPPQITSACGMDAFTQLLEPYLSPASSPITDALALSGLENIRGNLIPSCTNKALDLQVRANMAYASLLSGVVLANAGLGVVHGLASPIGGFFPIPHGVVCGTLVAAATKVNIKALRTRSPADIALEKFANVGALFSKAPEKGWTYNCDALVEALEEWTEVLSLPRLSKFGMVISDLKRVVDNTSNRNNPILLHREEIEEIILSRI